MFSFTIILTLSFIRTACCPSSKEKSKPDFIIVGAGTSGCTLASRLCTSLPNAHILILERSRVRSSESELVVRAARHTFDAWVNPHISSVVVTKSASKNRSRSLIAISANTLGGASAINSGQFTIPPNGTFSNIYNIPGLSDTHALNILHNRVIPRVRPTATSDEITDSWLQAAHSVGMKNSNSPLQYSDGDLSFVSNAAFDEVGRRRDACTAYAPQTTCGNRLTIMQDARVESLVFEEKEPKRIIRGVKVTISNSKTLEFEAAHEVILSAGPYESPKLLQLSGIGPSEVLRRARVPIKHSLPVGRYAQARAIASVVSTYSGTIARNNDASKHSEKLLRESQLSFLRGEGGGVLSLRIGSANGRIKGLGEVTMVTGFPLGKKFPGERFFNRRVIRSTCVLDPRQATWSPLSIISSNSTMQPEVQFSALDSKQDRQRMIQCLRKLKLLHSNIPGTIEKFPNSENNEDLEKYVIETSQNGQHYVGGCAVGKVVDGRSFRVFGIEGLSVVDASILPSIPSGAGPLASVYIIAEHAADVIARRYSLSLSPDLGLLM